MIMKFRVVMMKYEIYVKYEVYAGFWWGNLRQSDHLGDPGSDGRFVLIWIFRK